MFNFKFQISLTATTNFIITQWANLDDKYTLLKCKDSSKCLSNYKKIALKNGGNQWTIAQNLLNSEDFAVVAVSSKDKSDISFCKQVANPNLCNGIIKKPDLSTITSG